MACRWFTRKRVPTAFQSGRAVQQHHTPVIIFSRILAYSVRLQNTQAQDIVDAFHYISLPLCQLERAH
jgi:hypothetical protein